MRVLLFNDFEQLAGAETAVAQLREGIAGRGGTARLVTKDAVGSASDTPREKRYERLHRIFDEFSPDLVHVHNTLELGLAPIKVARERKAPVVWTMHDYRGICPNTLLFRPDQTICRDIHDCGTCYHLPRVVRADRDRLKMLLKPVTKVAISAAQASYFKEHWDAEVIHWDADRQLLQRGETLDEGKPDTIFFGGRKDSEKGFDFALMALSRLKKKRPELRMICAGASRAGDLRGRINQYRVQQQVIDHGLLPRPVYLELLEKARLVLCISIWAEPFNLTLLEALALGRPVIATDTGAHREVAGDAALYVAPRSSGELVDAIERVLGDAVLRADLARKARVRARLFTGCVDKYTALYERLMRR